MTYMPSTSSGVSAEDQSPEIPAYFLDEEAKSEKRMKRLMHVLKKSRKMQDILDSKVKKLQDFVDEEKTSIKNQVLQINQKDSDKISSPSHEVVGPRGPPGPPGVNGLAAANGINGAPGPEGPRGRQGDTGPPGAPGARGAKGSSGQRGVTGVQGIKGIVGPGGHTGPEGPEDQSGTWGANKYFCPGAATKDMRLMDCNTGSCRLETRYNGVWGSVCDSGFSQKSADVLCKALGFPEGGKARRHGGGAGPIWLSRVNCVGNEGDIGDCPKTCGAPGCGHGNDVGLCCYGFVNTKKGHRKNTRIAMKTVHQLRSECYKPDACPAMAKGAKTVRFNQNCGNPPKGGWQSSMGIGEYARFSKGVCDDDKQMCVHKCGMEDNQLGSMDIPEGLAVKLYDGRAFTGSKITYYGPRRVDCLNWEGWQNRPSSIKIMKTKKRPRSAWTVRVFHGGGRAINTMPSSAALDYVGTGVTNFINFHSAGEIAKVVSGTPTYNYMVTFYGNVKVTTGGKYQFCTTSSDGSYLYVGSISHMVVNNGPGRHGVKQVCNYETLKSGNTYHIIVKMFKGGSGGSTIQAMWSGPDTQGNSMLLTSSDAVSAVPPPPRKSNWALRMFSASWNLQIIPDIDNTKYLGSKTGIKMVDFSNLGQLRNLVPSTPSSNYVWVFYGSLRIEQAGKYYLCTNSDDGSKLELGGTLVVNNDGLHGPRNYCGSINLKAGDHDVEVTGFQAGGGVYQRITYSGPDTGGSEILMGSKGSKAGDMPKLPLPTPSIWKLRVYSTTYKPIEVMPDPTMMTFVQEADVEYVKFRNTAELKALVPKTPNDLYAWVAYGTLKIKKAGVYNLCTNSDDGSYMYVDKNMEVNNDGLHGPVNKCADVSLSAGNHQIIVAGFQNYGGVYQDVTYRGPDTANIYRGMRSIGKGNGAWAPQDVAQTPYKIGRWPPKTPPSYKAGGWPNGYCWPLGNTCSQLGIVDNQCGKCTALPNGGVRIENSHGLRFNGASYDDNQIGKGSYQARNICMLAKYGNGGTITKKATADSAGFSIYSSSASQVHWYGNCRMGDTKQAQCCSNAELLQSGFDWNKFSKGNSCKGDNDRDYVLGKVDCYFEK